MTNAEAAELYEKCSDAIAAIVGDRLIPWAFILFNPEGALDGRAMFGGYGPGDETESPNYLAHLTLRHLVQRAHATILQDIQASGMSPQSVSPQHRRLTCLFRLCQTLIAPDEHLTMVLHTADDRHFGVVSENDFDKAITLVESYLETARAAKASAKLFPPKEGIKH